MGAQWPPLGISAINPFELPLLNTVILLSSGITVTYAHHSLIQGNRPGVLYGLIFTIVLAVVFTICQGVEYTVSSLSDGSFGFYFYFGTGFTGYIHASTEGRCKSKKVHLNYFLQFKLPLKLHKGKEYC